MASVPPAVTVVLCRHNESIGWALAAFRDSDNVQLLVYNNGPPLHIPEERPLRNVGREAFCYLTHMLSVLRRGVHAISNFTIFSQAAPMFDARRGGLYSGRPAQAHIMNVAKSLAAGRSQVYPRGFSTAIGRDSHFDGTHGHYGPFMSWNTPPRCYQSEWSRLLGTSYGWSWAADRQLLYTPTAQFVVARANLWNAPRGWMRRAWVALNRTELFPWRALCQGAGACKEEQTRFLTKDEAERSCCARVSGSCLPWMLERLWAILLSDGVPSGAATAHRGAFSEPQAVAVAECRTIQRRLDMARASISARLMPAWSGDGTVYRAFVETLDDEANGDELIRLAAEKIDTNAQGNASVLVRVRRIQPWLRPGAAHHAPRRAAEKQCLALCSDRSLLVTSLPHLRTAATLPNAPLPNEARGTLRATSSLIWALQFVYGECVGLVLLDSVQPMRHFPNPLIGALRLRNAARSGDATQVRAGSSEGGGARTCEGMGIV